ncbi:MAG: 50S ribosomal protein L35 [Armatimonadota bacterium]|nr:50S ribosomal protein L35 [Armatimonadota bacterium]MDR7452296.1 50S ribosomal protein L35 [Armatimonadota bacterium]MDR7467941.1 50S ribosomal protein L35 [Armatimonadota bacterium]MDR7494783.1 50S ribosomal protein L35 [Armatimonadota bacterium]MDR7499263.1 50S ribosomal protein L35 [Armatimonadota bacterium]
MGKAKTHQGTAKRILVTGRGQLRRRRQMAGHLKVSKRPARLRRLRREAAVSGADRRKIEALLPNR